MAMAAEHIELINESHAARRARLWSKTSFTLAVLGWLIIGSALNTIIFNSFPLKLATPEWHLSLIAALDLFRLSFFGWCRADCLGPAL
jgi:hypothetical protein